MDKTRILLADDHAMFRDGLREILNRQRDMLVIGEAANGPEAVRLAQDLAPDLILMDLHLPEMDGIAATRQITAFNPGVRVLVLTMDHALDLVPDCAAAGACGHVLKDVHSRELVETIRGISRGETGFGRLAAGKILAEFRRLASGASSRKRPGLSPRERQILELVAQGATNVEIAEKLCLSQQTIKNSLSRLYRKLDVHNRAGAAAYVIRGELARAA